MGDELGHRGTLSKGQGFILWKDVVKYAMVATALVPDYITKTGGEDEDRPKEQQDQAQSKDIVMPCEEPPEKGKPKILEPSWGMVSKKGIARLVEKIISFQSRGKRTTVERKKKEIPTR